MHDISIYIFTFNHEQFIEKCIRSILTQKCSYGYKIYVFDDCSTDGTTKIVKLLQSENPDKIFLHVNEMNKGVLYSAKGAILNGKSAKYISFLDGDDYWCYDGKLQKQIDFLEAHPEYAGCFHDAEIHQMNMSDNDVYMMKTQNRWAKYSQFNRYEPDFEPISLIVRNIIPTASLILRWNENLVRYIENYKFGPLSFSWALELEIIKNSKFKYFNECWSVYNDHPKGISKKYGIVDFKRNNIQILQSLLKDNFYAYFAPEIYSTICSEFRLMLKSKEMTDLGKWEYGKFIREYKKYLKLLFASDIKQIKDDYNVRNSRSVE
jgi:glycosyltransferase involved in cell wall biosynthesis